MFLACRTYMSEREHWTPIFFCWVENCWLSLGVLRLVIDEVFGATQQVVCGRCEWWLTVNGRRVVNAGRAMCAIYLLLTQRLYWWFHVYIYIHILIWMYVKPIVLGYSPIGVVCCVSFGVPEINIDMCTISPSPTPLNHTKKHVWLGYRVGPVCMPTTPMNCACRPLCFLAHWLSDA